MTDKEKQDKFKNCLIHKIIEYAETNAISKKEVSNVLCQLSREVQDGFGNVFKEGEK